MIDYRIGDCRELLKEIPDESVRLVVTSPPYNIGKPYGHYKDKIPLDKWQELISDVTREVYRILTPDGSFFLNLSPVPFGNDKEILPMPFLGYEIFKKNNLYLRNMINSSYAVINISSYIYIFIYISAFFISSEILIPNPSAIFLIFCIDTFRFPASTDE